MARPKKAILLADSDEFRMSLRAFMLENHGFAVVRATTAEEALRICCGADSWMLYALVTDALLEDMAGFELARRSKALLPDVPVVLTTSSTIAPGEFDWPYLAAFFNRGARPIDLVERLKLLTQRKRGPKKKPAGSVVAAMAAEGVA